MNHIEFLIEDSSGKVALEALLPKILNAQVTYSCHAYKGIGRIPRNLNANADVTKRMLLDQLPRLISGYGKAFSHDPADYRRMVVVICDLDDRDRAQFEAEVKVVIDACDPKPTTLLVLCIEEGEAWLLGDVDAVVAAYPKVNKSELLRYVPDSICGTWEFLADLVERGGSRALKKLGHHEVGRAKHRWAAGIAPKVDIQRNRSPSFQGFVEELLARIAM